MPKKITCVFQDCVLCGDRGKKKALALAKKGVEIEKISAFTDEGRTLCAKAVKAGVGCMPFFTDGEKITATIEELLEKPAKKVKKAKKIESEVGDVRQDS